MNGFGGGCGIGCVVFMASLSLLSVVLRAVDASEFVNCGFDLHAIRTTIQLFLLPEYP
jgi:hypothetical protein